MLRCVEEFLNNTTTYFFLLPLHKLKCVLSVFEYVNSKEDDEEREAINISRAETNLYCKFTGPSAS